jgi:hypothetical protein
VVSSKCHGIKSLVVYLTRPSAYAFMISGWRAS